MTKRVLVIDDDVDLCEEIAEILGDEGFFVRTVCDGREGQVAVKTQPWDVVILDYRMPGLNGLDILRFMKEHNLKYKVILATGRPFIEQVLEDEGLSTQVTSLFGKPFNVGALIEELKTQPG